MVSLKKKFSWYHKVVYNLGPTFFIILKVENYSFSSGSLWINIITFQFLPNTSSIKSSIGSKIDGLVWAYPCGYAPFRIGILFVTHLEGEEWEYPRTKIVSECHRYSSWRASRSCSLGSKNRTDCDLLCFCRLGTNAWSFKYLYLVLWKCFPRFVPCDLFLKLASCKWVYKMAYLS